MTSLSVCRLNCILGPSMAKKQVHFQFDYFLNCELICYLILHIYIGNKVIHKKFD